MLSRVAESLFWMNRYMERVDSLLRVMRTNYILAFDTDVNHPFQWKDILMIFTSLDAETIRLNGENTAAAMDHLISDTKNINSIKILITKARENARGAQDNITKEVWEQVNHIYHIINQPELSKKLKGSRAIEILEVLSQNSILYYGVTDSTMPRGQGWNFMNLAKFIERCLLTIEISNGHFNKLNYHLDNAQDILHWRNLLLSLSGYELYLKTYTSGLHHMNVSEHVITNKNFPRSIHYCLDRIKRYLDDVISDTQIENAGLLTNKFGRLHSQIKFADMNNLRDQGLQHFLFTIRQDLIGFSTEFSRVYFSYT